jgi:hypothetical protein
MHLKLFKFTSFLLFLSPFFMKAATPTRFAGDPVFFLGPAGQALGGSVYSHRSYHDNLLTNPAAGAFNSEYSAEGSFSTAAKTIGVSVYDTKSTTYGGGLTYLRREVGNDDTTKPIKAGSLPQTYQSIGFSLFGRLQESFAIGVTGRYSMRENTGVANANAKTWNGDVGLAYKVSEKLGFGAVYKNIFGDSKDVEITVLGGGAHFEVYPGLKVVGSVEKYMQPSEAPRYGVPDEDKISWSLGAEYKYSGLSLRGAFRESGPWDSQLAFGGIGYTDKGFHVAYSFGTATKGDALTVHTFGLGAVF